MYFSLFSHWNHCDAPTLLQLVHNRPTMNVFDDDDNYDACAINIRVFPSLGRVWRSRSKVKSQGHQGQRRHFPALSAACVRFIFDKTLASAFCFEFNLRARMLWLFFIFRCCFLRAVVTVFLTSWLCKYIYKTQDFAHVRPNSITLSSSKLVGDQLRTS